MNATAQNFTALTALRSGAQSAANMTNTAFLAWVNTAVAVPSLTITTITARSILNYLQLNGYWTAFDTAADVPGSVCAAIQVQLSNPDSLIDTTNPLFVQLMGQIPSSVMTSAQIQTAFVALTQTLQSPAQQAGIASPVTAADVAALPNWAAWNALNSQVNALWNAEQQLMGAIVPGVVPPYATLDALLRAAATNAGVTL
jgi:hypothetical protein